MIQYEELSRDIIGAAMAVLNELKPGLDEKLYENALILELKHRRRSVDQQCTFPVKYRNESIGTLIPDLIVDGCVIVDAKVVTAFNDNHIAQMMGYLAITKMQVGLLINFKHATLEWKSVVR
jgi:GxxExxY protein